MFAFPQCTVRSVMVHTHLHCHRVDFVSKWRRVLHAMVFSYKFINSFFNNVNFAHSREVAPPRQSLFFIFSWTSTSNNFLLILSLLSNRRRNIVDGVFGSLAITASSTLRGSWLMLLSSENMALLAVHGTPRRTWQLSSINLLWPQLILTLWAGLW